MTEDNDKLNEEQVRLLKLLKQVGFKHFGLRDFIVKNSTAVLIRGTSSLVHHFYRNQVEIVGT